MTLYAVIFDFFATYVFTSADMPASSFEIGGANVAFADWWCHTATIATLVALLIVVALCLAGLVKMVAHGLTRIGG